MTQPWPAGASTGIGSLPGTDALEASRMVLGEVAQLPYLPELPQRGLGADMVGRTASLLVDLPVEFQLHGWTVTARAGRDAGTARDWLRRDVDVFTELASDRTGTATAKLEVIKLQVCGPLTLAASIELVAMHKLLSDHGAVADLVESLTEGVALHIAELRRRLPGTAIVLQVDEPSLPAVLGGRIPTPSGYDTVRSLAPQVVQDALHDVLAGSGADRCVVHCCAPDAPLRLLRDAGADALTIEVLQPLRAERLDTIGELIESGASIWAGTAPGTDADVDLARLRAPIDRLWNQLGFSRNLLAATVVPTPACGFAGASLPYVRRVTELLRDVGRVLVEDPD